LPTVTTLHDDGALPGVNLVPAPPLVPTLAAPLLLLEVLLDAPPPLLDALPLEPASPLDAPPAPAPSRPKNFAA
jgi:hypothetical protein